MSRSGSIPCGNLRLTLDIPYRVKCYQSLTPIQEMLGLTWDCIDISRTSIFVNKELQRVNWDALEKLDDKGVIMKFPAALSSTNTRLVLKEPKTKTSIRKVFLPKTVAEMLIARKKEIEELKELFGSEFTDY